MKKLTSLAIIVLAPSMAFSQAKNGDTVKTKQIEEVVLVGYGTQKKASVSGNITTLDKKLVQAMQSRPVTNLTSALQGTMAGVTVMGRPSDIGGVPAVNILGRGNLSNATAMYIVDGVIVTAGDFARISPNDVESMSVLKDASAAIYGSRAANGVILVTTKKGTGGKMTMSYDAMTGFAKAAYLPKSVGSVDYMMLRNEAASNAGGAAVYSAADIEKAKSGLYPDLYPNTDWYKLLYKSAAPIMKHNFSVTGGGSTRYYLGTEYMNQESLQPGKDLKRYSVRANTTSKVNDKFTVGTNMSFVKDDLNTKTGPFSTVSLARMTPTMVAMQSDGSWGTMNAGKLDATLGGDNPLRILKEGGHATDNSTRFFGTLVGTYTPLKGLVFEGQLSYNNRNQITSSFTNTLNPLINFLTKAPITGSNRSVNSYEEKWYNENNLASQVYGSYEKQLSKHYFKVLVGTSYEDWKYKYIQAKRNNYVTNGMDAIGGGSNTDGNVFNDGVNYARAFNSYFSRVNYNYDERYFLEGVFRADGSSQVANQHRWGYFPGIMASWRIDNESFMENVSFINDLKLRGSYGKMGNMNLGYWDYLSFLDTGTAAVLDQGKVDGVWPSKVANPSLLWEEELNKNIGLDGTMFNRHLSFTLNYFNRLRSKIQMKAQLPDETGASTSEWPSENKAKVSNKGFEVMLGYQNNGKEFNYYLNANLSRTWNTIEDLVGQGPFIDGYYIQQQGGSMGSFYGYKTAGLYTQQDVASKYPKFSSATKPGDIKYVDLNGDGKISSDDRTVLGNDVPYFTFGLNGGFTYKNFDFNFLAQGVKDVKVYLDSEASQAFFNGAGAKEYVLGRWTVDNPNPNAVYPRVLTSGNNTQNLQISDFWLFNADYIRVKSLVLGYSLPKATLDSLGMQKLRIYISGENMFTIRGDKRMKDFDPETASGRATYPQVKTISFGINTTF